MEKPTIHKLLTPYNFSSGSTERIQYIVIHYVGALGGAKDNCQYYASKYIGASAHYYVGFQGEIWQSVEDASTAWAVGASSYVHPYARNSNTLHIEMCVRKKSTTTMNATDKDWYFEDATVNAAIELTRYLMDKYHVPASNVIRHYDVTGKYCPNPYVYNTTSHTWTAFKEALTETNLYRIRKAWTNALSQIGAYSSKENAIRACKKGYHVYDSTGKKVYSSPKETGTQDIPSQSYIVKVSASDLHIRVGAGTNYDAKGFTGKGTFTIVEEKEDSQGRKWGLLKSYEKNKNGWIALWLTCIKKV